MAICHLVYPFVAFLCVCNGDVYLVDATLSGLLPAAALHNIPIFRWGCVQGRPDSYSSLHGLDQTGHLFFPQPVRIAANMHQRYRTICHLTSLLLELCRVENEFERGKTLRTGASLGELNKKWLTFSQASTAIFPFCSSGKRRTWIITKDVLCGEFQGHIRRRQRK